MVCEGIMTYKVQIDDNFDYMDESERVAHGEFETLGAAIEACKKIVDEYLATAYKPGMTARDLYSNYVGFGDAPWISGVEGVPFSAWRSQPVDATQALNLAAGVWKSKVFRGRSFNRWATLFRSDWE